jgi:hypothetical protein
MNALKHTSLTAIILGLACALFLSCSDSGQATVNISLELPKNVSVTKQAPDSLIDRVLRFFASPARAQYAPEGITALALRVSGPGMTTFEKRYPVDTLLIALAVESGKDRTFLVKAYDADNRVSWAGSTTVELKSGETKLLLITMKDTLRMVQNINNDDSGQQSSNPTAMTLFNGKLYFFASAGNYRELWVLDPATETASQAVHTYTGPPWNIVTNMTVFDNRLFFTAYDTMSSTTKLYSYDGISAIQEHTCGDFAPNPDPQNLTVLDGLLFFSANYSDGYSSEPFVLTSASVDPQLIYNISDIAGSTPLVLPGWAMKSIFLLIILMDITSIDIKDQLLYQNKYHSALIMPPLIHPAARFSSTISSISFLIKMALHPMILSMLSMALNPSRFPVH